MPKMDSVLSEVCIALSRSAAKSMSKMLMPAKNNTLTANKLSATGLPVRQDEAEQVVIQTRCSVYNVYVDKKCEQEGMKVGNDFGSTSLKPNPSEQS